MRGKLKINKNCKLNALKVDKGGKPSTTPYNLEKKLEGFVTILNWNLLKIGFGQIQFNMHKSEYFWQGVILASRSLAIAHKM